jgi:hypothetical protein
MNELGYINLLNKKERLTEICETPKLYLANYFSDLRRDIDLEIVQKKEPNNKKLNQLWLEIIKKIDSFENECINNIKLNRSEIRASLNQIECLIQSKQPNLEKINEFIQNEQENILKQLFRNRTIIFKQNNHIIKDFREKLINGKLLIVNDEFINAEAVKEKYFKILKKHYEKNN